ncbi:uncharacterized protein LOC132553515 [Ylistrum balloti]|uniref:uncharacterized protein LOC132553515 n=1 Tax=Ylistrum balloti TaxID=509963 RepID=UPI0029058868|nr:uncharacterized protein LOC132553515 [Ylistrum balloti]
MATPISAGNNTTSQDFDRDTVVKALKENGYAVVKNVLTHEQCEEYIQQYKSWMKKFDRAGTECSHKHSIIQSYRTGHFATTWAVRLHVKPVFAKIWKTEKLLSSADAVAISKPPEEGSDDYADPNREWLHLDQAAHREGLHAFQGGINLEESTDTDHCFRVMAGSHVYHKKFFQTFPNAAEKSRRIEHYKLNDVEKNWYEQRGCKRTKVPVPKGGMVLWDSRTVHDNIKPEYGRINKDRWRFVVFVSMTPAIWAFPEDLAKKRDAYENLMMTSHWSSQGVRTFKEYNPKKDDPKFTILTQPDIAKTREAKLLFGVEDYDFEDEKPNGPKPPTWQDYHA